MVSWGDDGSGLATPPAGLSGVRAVAAGWHHSLALKTDGTVAGWGWNDFGQATPPAGLSGIVAIAAGGVHSLALKNDGTVVGWGYNVPIDYHLSGQATPPPGLSGVIAIAAGEQHGLALKNDGTVVRWGQDWYGKATPPAGLTSVVAISAGEQFSIALVRPSLPAMVTNLSPPLNGGEVNSLLKKLENAQTSLNRGSPNAACGQMNAFANEVEALIRRGN